MATKRSRKPRGLNVCFVVPVTWHREVDEVVKRKHYVGRKLNKSDILRAALRIGLNAMKDNEAEALLKTAV